MSIIFEIIDKTGRRMKLTQTQWGHICEHNEMMGQIERIQETLQSPFLITEGYFDKCRHYYVRHYKQAPRKGKFLIVVVKYLNNHGIVLTAFYASKPSQ